MGGGEGGPWLRWFEELSLSSFLSLLRWVRTRELGVLKWCGLVKQSGLVLESFSCPLRCFLADINAIIPRLYPQ
jgi:hypothetical protein